MFSKLNQNIFVYGNLFSLQEFRAKAYDEKYTAAAYKCTDCLKGFSEEDMLKRHIKIRHSEVF